MENWYGISTHQFQTHEGGTQLLKRYSSIEGILRALYPEFQWDSTRFTVPTRRSPGAWKNLDFIRKYFDSLTPLLNISEVVVVLPPPLSQPFSSTIFFSNKLAIGVVWHI